MTNEDLDALAAEYVLGTLAPDERTHAEAMMAIDRGFVDIVHQWERRLGELNVMVEAVEPPAEIWDKIKSSVMPATPGDDVRLVPIEPTPLEPPKLPSATKPEGAAFAPPVAPAASPLSADVKPVPRVEAEVRPAVRPEAQPSVAAALLPPAIPARPQTEQRAEVVDFGPRMRRWRGVAVVATALAAVLAAFIVVSQVDPGFIPPGGFHMPQLIAQRSAPAPAAATSPQGSRLIAVLQQAPSAPAFLLTIDPAGKTLTVRRVAAQPAAGHSYELWFIPSKSTTPQPLGVIGEQEFTQSKLPAKFDLATARAATYAVSFEPPGGSKTGAPTGPILFTGRPFETAAPPPPPANPKT